MATLYIVATPIGNLKDITLRAIETLKEVDFILCEDTRITKKLLNCYQIEKPTISYHQHSQLRRVNEILELLRQGKDLALVSDAGTPGIADPGGKLIEEVVLTLGQTVNIIPIPGPMAVTVAISVSGFPANKFFFAGFPPSKNKRKKFFEEIAQFNYPVVFFESPYRIIKTLTELKALTPQRKIVICQELTKKFETIYRGNTEEILKQLEIIKVLPKKLKGEFTIVLAGTERNELTRFHKKKDSR